jgi:hypothetical protein
MFKKLFLIILVSGIFFEAPVEGAIYKDKSKEIERPNLKLPEHLLISVNLAAILQDKQNGFLGSSLSIGHPVNGNNSLTFKYMGGSALGFDDISRETYLDFSLIYSYPAKFYILFGSIGTGISVMNVSRPNVSRLTVPLELKTMIALSKDIAFGLTYTTESQGVSSLLFGFQFGDPFVHKNE